MIIHDYICNSCGIMIEDVLGEPEPCPCGSNSFDVTFQGWKKLVAMNRGRSSTDLVDAKGFRSAFNASEDPVCGYELGTIPDAGIRTFTQEQASYYAGKVLKDGDNPTLRKEILAERKKNLETKA